MDFLEINELLSDQHNIFVLNLFLCVLWVIVSIIELFMNVSGFYLLFNGFFLGVNTHIVLNEWYKWNMKK